MPTTSQAKKFSLEKSLTELEKLIAKMETGQLSLEESLKLFEQGVSLTKLCQESLTSAEQKVQQLIGKHKNKELIDYFEEEE
jgi:exodeoxyribonuclease VII small subunit